MLPRTPRGRSPPRRRRGESVREVRELAAARRPSARSATRPTTCSPSSSQDFRARYPDVRVRVSGQNSAEVADAVRDGKLEAGLIALPIDDRGLDVAAAIDDEILYVSADPERVKSR